MGRVLLIALLLVASVWVKAQDTRSIPMVSVRADKGSITQTNDFLTGTNAHGVKMKDYSSMMIEIGVQSQGSKTWHSQYDFPSYGVGLYTATLENQGEIGRPWSLFGFYRGTLWRSESANHTFRYNIEAGLAWNWRCYDENTNPYNITIGSPVTAHIGLGLDYSYRVCKNLQIGVGGGFTHFSNGAVRKPNKGLNLMGANVRLTYLLREEKYGNVLREPTKMNENEIDFTLGMGIKRYECDTVSHPELTTPFKLGSRYTVSTFQAVFLHQYSVKGKYGAGLNVTYDDWLGSDTRTKADGRDVEVVHGKTSKRINLGVILAHEFCIARLSIPTQLGFYVYQPSGIEQKKKRSFQRMGVEYTFPVGIQTGVNIFAHQLSKADFIEWHLGYRLQLSRQK